MSEDRQMKRFVARERAERLKRQGDLAKAEVILKALNVTGPGMLKEGMAVPFVLEKHPNLKDSFEKGISAESLLLMIDLSPFSDLVAKWTPEEIGLFLERYYRIVVSRVTAAGGVVEKYIGDAVIAIFGEPFESETSAEHLEAVIRLARSLIKEVEAEFKGEVTAKCAISHGACHFRYLGPSEHTELTIVGTPLTELFRLEADCPKRSVILPKWLFDHVREKFPLRSSTSRQLIKLPPPEWTRSEEELELRGVGVVEVVISTLRSDSE